MTALRAPRGCRVLGSLRLSALIVAVSALMALGVSVAGASSGGAGTGGGKPGSGRHASAHNTQSNPFVGRGMWIWELPSSNGGNVSSIIARAHRYGINVLMIKSGDGSGTWSQFTPGLVSRLHAAGFRVCGWQYVYGAHPVFEAQVGAATVRDGADCLLIDAEAEYENRANNYMQAQTYISQLRRQIGASFPLALAGFPYMDFHPGFPFSVFLGPGGAQYNVPQMYWFDIGTSVDHVYSHTYALNRIYQRPIFPLGQIYNSPPLSDIRRFRQLSRAYGAAGVSWWDWQEASPGDWRAMSQPVGWLNTFQADASLASVSRGAQGDLVVWAQEHLFAAGQRLPIDGSFGSRTQSAVRRFQRATGLPVTGTIGRLTWQRLLRYQPVRVRWTTSGARTSSVGGYSLTMPVPASSRLPAKRNEIAGAGGAGRPKH